MLSCVIIYREERAEIEAVTSMSDSASGCGGGMAREEYSTNMSRAVRLGNIKTSRKIKMAALDPRVAEVLDKQRSGHDDEDEDALIAELEADDDTALNAMREKRLEQLHAEVSRAKLMKETAHGTYMEIKNEEDVMSITTSTKLCIVHFMKPDFNRCRIMDDRLRVLAEKHFDTRFVSINVDNAPFLVVKLNIKVLPCVIAFKDGVGVDRIIGFEGVGYRPDSITVSELETRLLQSGVLVRAKMTEDDDRRRVQRERERAEDEVVDDDWD